MTARVIGIAGPVTVWALHFIAVYALISAACAPRGLIAPDLMRAVAALGTLVLALPVLAWLVFGLRALRRTPEDPGRRALATAAAWSAGISLLAILANLWPVAALRACTG